ncbi:MAG: transglutaminase domain-containing protein [Bacteroidota bacterium]|nr:transglutaminase domain-containing protein [Bacteroidota bacterium]
METAKIKKYKSVPDLSKQLTSNYTKDIDKVRSIFCWITQNIIYDVNEFHNDSAHKFYNYIKYKTCVGCGDSLYNAKIIDSVLRKKAAICDGYARLFKTLCMFSGIRSEMIIGMGKNDIEQLNVYESNHAWNAVSVDNRWFLLDACWASGTCDSATMKFTPALNEFYFFTDPRQFSYSHFPDEKKYFHYDNALSKQTFISMPLVFDDFFLLGFDSFTPLNGLSNIKNEGKMTVTVSKLFTDKEMAFSGTGNIETKKSEIKYTLEQKLGAEKTKTLIVYYKHKAILEYKVK